MSEYVVLEVPSIFRWNGAKQGRTMFSATGGRLVLTDQRLVFVSQQVTDDIALGHVTGCELTGRMGNLTVHLAGPAGAPRAVTFGTQQLGMPIGEHWVRAILGTRDATRAGSVTEPAPMGDADRVWAAQHGAYQRFVAAGTGPRLVSWRLADVLGEQTLPASQGRIEVWRDVDSVPPIGYVGVVALYQPNGVLRLLLTAEVAPELHDECYLGAFLDGVHHNIGADPAMRDPDSFVQWGIGAALSSVMGPAQEPAAAAAPSPDEARQILQDLGDRGAARPEGMPEPEVAQHLARAHAALAVLAAEARVLDALAVASRNPADPAALHTAGAGLMSLGLHEVAVPLLGRSLDLGGRDPDTVNRLALCQWRRESDAGALTIFRRHAWSTDDQGSRGWCAHYAAMCGDLTLAREMLAGITAPQAGTLLGRAQRRLARADALERIPGGLRDWVAVLHGGLLLHSSSEGEDVMNGRYAAVWDSTQRLTDVLTLLEWALVRTRRRPRHVVTFPDRDSVVLGHLIRDRLGIGLHGPGDDGTTLVVRYMWTDDGHPFLAQYRDEPSAVLFAYGLCWTTDHEVTPDIVGLEAQLLTPLWDGTTRLVPDAERGWRQESSPPDARGPESIASELAATTAAMPAYVQQDIEGLGDVVAALQRSSIRPGLLGGVREPYVTGGPVTSNRFP